MNSYTTFTNSRKNRLEAQRTAALKTLDGYRTLLAVASGLGDHMQYEQERLQASVNEYELEVALLDADIAALKSSK